MHSKHSMIAALAIASLLHSVASAPVPQDVGQGINNNDLPNVYINPPGSTGYEYGPESLLGNDGNPINPADTAVITDGTPVPNQELPADYGMYLDFTNAENPQPIRGANGATDPGPRTYNYDRINSDSAARPGTDYGTIANGKWPLGLSTNRAGVGQNSGWSRQQNIDNLPVATAMAGVDMRLSPHAYREMHWHSANEWSYIFNGSVRIATVNQNGENFVDDLQAGDLWFFPAGVPHSIQALDQGAEFILVFNQGDFSDDDTDLLSEVFMHNPKEVLAKNFETDVSDFDDIPTEELYIFPGTPAPANISAQNVTGPAGYLPKEQSYSYHLSQQAALVVPGGTVRIVDPTTFHIASNFSVGLFTLQPGAMREIHWHLDSDEWSFFIAGSARATVFAGPSNARTFDFSAGDVGYIPVADSHYIENVGTEDVVYLEILQAPRYTDLSLGQWLGLTPSQVVRDTLRLPQSLLDRLPTEKTFLKPGNPDLGTLNFTRAAGYTRGRGG